MKSFIISLLLSTSFLVSHGSNNLLELSKGSNELGLIENKLNCFKDYNKIITKEAVTKNGFITTHSVNGKLYFEIPKNILGRDFLLASRVSQLSDNSKVAAGQMYTNPIMLRFGVEDAKVFIYKPAVDMLALSSDSPDLKLSLKRNAMTPIWAVYDIVTINPDTKAVVIDVTKLFEKEIDELTPFKGRAKPGSLNTKAGKLLSVKAFPKNIEIKNRFIYKGKSHFVAIMHRSLVLLSEKPMNKRMSDSRIGYLASSKFQLVSSFKGTEREAFIHRWRIEPKQCDMEKYKRGELVEPAKQIVYYVDDALPEKWRKYVKAGIEDWQVAFEAIGFKNAIVAKDYPVDDPNFDPENISCSCFRYIASATANAMGPSWIDPRSGEIIQGDVIWYHNVISRLYTWRFVQTAAVDRRIRELEPDDELLGEAIRYAAAHEIGHTLGLSHNFGASYSIPVDSLRSASFTQKYGTTASIMDYARFNYVAQPGDKGVKLTPPLLGEYDKFAIKYGYKLIPGTDNYKDEYGVLNSWFFENKNKPMLQFGEQGMFGSVPDPSAQAEDLGDDAVKAGKYGIQNLKYICANLIDWLREENKGYGHISEINTEIEKQFERYLNRAVHFIGGVYKYDRVQGEQGAANIPVSVKKQKECIDFIFDQMRNQPQWMIIKELEERTTSKSGDIYKFHTGMISKLLDRKVFARLLDLDRNNVEGIVNSSLSEYLEYLNNKMWEVARDGDLVDGYEKNLQAQYVNTLIGIVAASSSVDKKGKNKGIKPEVLFSMPLVKNIIKDCKKELKSLMKKTKSSDRYHYEYLYDIIVASGY